jgi:hypothetical protein
MKKSLSLLLRILVLTAFLFALLLTTGCGAKDTVAITADPDTYSPLMSSVQGITLTPDFETKKDYEELVYRWETEEGGFVGQGKEVTNQGETVVWSAVEGDQLTEIEDDFDIKLEVVEGESGKVLATAEITITTTDPGFYSIKE